MSRVTLSPVVLRLCGLVLLAAVALKVQGMAAGGVGESLALFSPRVQSLGLQVEALVGVWLVSGFARRGAWLAGLGLYAVLAGVSVYLIAVGQPSCGCFGRVEVSPWISLSLDAACVGLLAAFRPAKVGEWLAGGTLLRMAVVVLAVGGLLLALTSEVAMRELAWLRGETLLVSGGDADAGIAMKGESRDVAVTVENLGNTDLHLIGGTKSCSCVAIGDLPLSVPAGGSATANVTIKFTGEVGRFKHTYMWYTDAPTQPSLSGSIAGEVAAAAE